MIALQWSKWLFSSRNFRLVSLQQKAFMDDLAKSAKSPYLLSFFNSWTCHKAAFISKIMYMHIHIQSSENSDFPPNWKKNLSEDRVGTEIFQRICDWYPLWLVFSPSMCLYPKDIIWYMYLEVSNMKLSSNKYSNDIYIFDIRLFFFIQFAENWLLSGVSSLAVAKPGDAYFSAV